MRYREAVKLRRGDKLIIKKTKTEVIYLCNPIPERKRSNYPLTLFCDDGNSYTYLEVMKGEK
jgi:bifunctional DNA-binding transcriptional regulator/antitoxin component of YhaV-PrlF toxin-antitoxin module